MIADSLGVASRIVMSDCIASIKLVILTLSGAEGKDLIHIELDGGFRKTPVSYQGIALAIP
jgi:hypothetical protein